METNKIYYSSKCLRPTQDSEGNDTSIMGFFWTYDHATYWNDTKKVDVVISWVVDSNQKAKFLWKESFDCEGQWSKDMCIEAVMSRPLFIGSKECEVVIKDSEAVNEEYKEVVDNPETEIDESVKTSLYSKVLKFVNSFKWF